MHLDQQKVRNTMATVRLLLAAAIAVGPASIATGCGGGSGFIECRDDTSCERFNGGECVVNAATGNQFCTYPDDDCDSGSRWSDLDVEGSISGTCVVVELDAGVGAIDAESDAATTPDANTDGPPPPDDFDVGYVSEWRLGTSGTSVSQYEWVRVVNMGSAPLDLSTAQIIAVTDNHPQIVVNMTWQPVATVLQPGFSAGALSPGASTQIVGSGLVTEPAQNTIDGLIHLSVTNLPASGTWLVVDGEATLQIGDARAVLNVRVTSSGTGSSQTAFAGARAQSAPVP